jgi:hypothetical protein
MSWFGNTLLPVIQNIFWDRLWEPCPKKAARIFRQDGHQDVADYVEKMTPESWIDTCRWALPEGEV